MRRLQLGALMGTLVISTSLATAQDGGSRVPPSEQVSGGTGMGGVDTPDMMSSEGEIVAAVAAADRDEITLGSYAQSRASNLEVREFARMMVTAHTDASARMSAIAQRLNITPVEGAESRSLITEATATRRRLSRLRGAAFDRSYLDAEIASHSHLLDVIDRKLIPSARTADLRTALQNDTRPMVATHLAHARSLRERI